MTTFTRRQVIGAGGAMLATQLLASRATAQAWPTQPIRIMTGFAPGGLTDLAARSYGEYIQMTTGRAVIVESKTGAGGALATGEVKRAAPDGHTLLLTSSSALILAPHLLKNPGFDPDKDFTLISYMPTGNAVAFVRTDLGISNLKELVEYARKHPVNAGTSGPGGFMHLAIVELNRYFDLKIEPVHYRGEALSTQALHTGEVQMQVGTWSGARLPVRAGTARAIAVTGTKRAKRLPDVMTFEEQGVTTESFRLTSYLCVLGPAGMPEPVAQRLSDLFVQAGSSEKVQKFMDTFEMDEPALGRAAFRDIYDQEAPVWVKMVKGLGLTPQ